ncbi:helix-turn-helix domain-containing protein [Geomicrobium sediminis]|uniref:Cytoskeletal protein RodZ n=1 Tax=Geomicrobium sediminis TaxID=1347788 RepID=A0ABS2PBG8_9BACL|nr:RodZ domain-containing protein [Geomicrobium sediminis]MBM7632654.1 cytoskeletal protein RodZ [Geomicrobium sediminis]
MTELGQFLQSKREEFGWDLEEVQKRTKIQKRYLLAIESGDYGDLPGAFYARAFIKSYSEALGLEPDEVFQQFESDLPKPKQEAVDLPSRVEQQKTRTKERKKKSNYMPAIFIGLFLIAIVAGIWAIMAFPSGTDEAAPEEESMNIVGTTPDEEEDDEVGDDEGEEDTSSTEGTTEDDDEAQNEDEDEPSTDETLTFEETNNNESLFTVTGDSFAIDLEFDGESYIQILDERNGTVIGMDGVFSSDESFEVDDQDSITMNVGNTYGVTITVNGEELEYPVDTHHHFITLELEE